MIEKRKEAEYIGWRAFPNITYKIMADRQKQYKLINARIMKWRDMLEKGIHKDKDLLWRRVKKGIPTSLRIIVWPQLTKSNKAKHSEKCSNYINLLAKESNYVGDINLDIPRTSASDCQQILRQSLFHVLRALSIEFPKIGYCQGMNFIVMRLIEILSDQDAYLVMARTIKKHKPIYENFCNPGFVKRQNHVFMQLLRKYIPAVHKQLYFQKINTMLFIPSWFLTLFSKILQPQQFYRFFQCFLLKGYLYLYRMALTLIKLKQKQIIRNSVEQNLLFIPDSSQYQAIDPSTLIQMNQSWNISTSMILQIQSNYNVRCWDEHNTIYQQILRHYEHKIKSPKKIQWTIEDFKKTDASLITFEDDFM